ncbi:conserved hypothetical protein [Candidatus Methylobacter favarea]|uniref:Type II secretion system protein GspC N-terminal domain-containing protein n=1 Tax=Candidatus Methylobacter favarea TaxID=2707345 RepID=A0A8S0X2S6_9GAMM|nr:hypothetical protein [Candidatus Methylobacter favarea]CAA9892164.1 conserved hypothetical protein [Candidatus Methylobacter favarea]
MNVRLIKLMAAACAVLMLIIGCEWLYAKQAQKNLLGLINSGKAPLYQIDEMPRIELSRQHEENYADLVARPLFIKGRRPVDEPRLEEGQAMAAAETFDWLLNGVYSTKKGLSAALFSRSNTTVAKDNHRRITKGTAIDGWTLTEIKKDRVIMTLGAKQKELLLRKPKPKNSPAPKNTPNPANTPPMPEAAEGDFENNNNEYTGK